MPPDHKPFERRWTDEQKQAIAWACIDRRPALTAQQAAKAGALGELPDGKGGHIEPFGKRREDGQLEPMPKNTAQDIVRSEKQARAVRARGRLAKATDVDMALRLVLSEAWDDLDKARDTRRKAKLTPDQLTKAIRGEVATARALHAAEADLKDKPSNAKGQQRTTEKAPQTDDAKRLATEAKRRAKTEHHDPPTHTDSARDTTSTEHKAPDSTNGHATDSVAPASKNGSTVSNPSHIDRARMGSMMQGQDASPLDRPAGSS